MELTAENKAHIESLTLQELLAKWRFAPVGDPWFRGATGDYWKTRMCELRDKPGGAAEFTGASKALGW